MALLKVVILNGLSRFDTNKSNQPCLTVTCAVSRMSSKPSFARTRVGIPGFLARGTKQITLVKPWATRVGDCQKKHVFQFRFLVACKCYNGSSWNLRNCALSLISSLEFYNIFIGTPLKKMFKSNTTGLETPLNYIYSYIYTYIQQQQVLQKCTGPQMARANLGGPVNLSVGNA